MSNASCTFIMEKNYGLFSNVNLQVDEICFTNLSKKSTSADFPSVSTSQNLLLACNLLDDLNPHQSRFVLQTERMLHHLPSEFMLFCLHTAIHCMFDFLFPCLPSAALLAVSISPYSSQTQPQHSQGLHTHLLMRSIVGRRGNGPVKDFRPCRIG